MLPDRAHVGVIDSQSHRLIGGTVFICNLFAAADIDQGICWVGRCFQVDHGKPVSKTGFVDDGFHFSPGQPGFEGRRMNTDFRKELVDKVVRTPVYRRAVEQQVAGFQKFEHHSRNCSHSALKNRAIVGLIPECKAVFKNLNVRIVDAAVDKSHLFIFAFFTQAVGNLKKGLALFGRFKNKGGCKKNGRFDCAFRERRFEPVRHHQALGFIGMLFPHSSKYLR